MCWYSDGVAEPLCKPNSINYHVSLEQHRNYFHSWKIENFWMTSALSINYLCNSMSRSWLTLVTSILCLWIKHRAWECMFFVKAKGTFLVSKLLSWVDFCLLCFPSMIPPASVGGLMQDACVNYIPPPSSYGVTYDVRSTTYWHVLVKKKKKKKKKMKKLGVDHKTLVALSDSDTVQHRTWFVF